MPFAFEERVAQPSELTTISKPWAACNPLGTGQSVAASHAQRAVVNRDQSTFHHYYKKHMTMLGLRDHLDSSDTDSETSENFQMKVFRRRHHRLRPVKTLRQREAEELESRRRERPWQQLVAPLGRIGLTPQPDDQEDRRRLLDGVHRGKQTTHFGRANEHLQEPPARGRASPADLHRAAVAQPAYRTSLQGEWDQREADAQAARRDFKRSGPRPTPDMFSPPPVGRAASSTPQPGSSSGGGAAPPRSKSSMGGATALKIVRTVRELKRDHVESMRRHRTIMEKCGGGAEGPSSTNTTMTSPAAAAAPSSSGNRGAGATRPARRRPGKETPVGH